MTNKEKIAALKALWAARAGCGAYQHEALRAIDIQIGRILEVPDPETKENKI